MTLLEEALATLPVAEVLGELEARLAEGNAAVLAAPPGAGKTTLVPLRLLAAPWRGDGRVILLEPRRLAARAAARRMAALLEESVGQTVGYRMRLDTKISKRTRIEVVTEGVFVRMIQDDPELSGIAAIIFDEFHERALDADFGLALALDVQRSLREDLRLLVMSATLDTGRVAALLGGAPVIASAGRAFPVDIRHVERRPETRIEDAVASAVRQALADEPGSILAFLPGQAEIRRTAERLEERLPPDVVLAPLYGMMDGVAQDLAIRPPAPGTRKVVLATSIAETSITIDGVRVVIDSGLSRQPRFEPGTGITRLETVRVSRASADQRAGRAGRTEPGIAIRLWRAEQTAALQPFAQPEILQSDLTGLVIDCAAWGVADPRDLAFIDPPPAAALSEATVLLQRLGALDASGLTAKGRAMRTLGLPARLAAMVASAQPADRLAAAELAILLGEPGLGGTGIDLAERHRRFRHEKGQRAAAARDLAARLARTAGYAGKREGSPAAGALLLEAYPDRLARQRGGRGRYLLANGRGAELDETDALAKEEFLVVADLTGRAGAQRILAAAALDAADVEAFAAREGEGGTECFFDPQNRSVRARAVSRIGAIVLAEKPLPLPKGEAVTAALVEGVRLLGIGALPWSKAGLQLRQRLSFLFRSQDRFRSSSKRRNDPIPCFVAFPDGEPASTSPGNAPGDPWPDVGDDALLARLDEWFAPFQPGVASFDAIPPKSLENGLMALLPYDLHARLDSEAPTHFTVPTGSAIAIDYAGEAPALAVRVQELFGLTRHPTIAGGRLPLVLHLLSPAHRPIQTTRDLPGFWAGSWSDVRAEMRGRYPKHVWPEDPAAAESTRRAKPRRQ